MLDSNYCSESNDSLCGHNVLDGHNHISDPIIVASRILAVVVIITGTLGNLTTIVALCRNQKLLQDTTTAFIISLCGSHLVFCAFNMPLVLALLLAEHNIFSENFCTFLGFNYYLNSGFSLMCLITVTTNRYFLIVYNHWYKIVFTKAYSVLIIFGSFVFVVLLLIAPLLEAWGRFGFEESTLACTIVEVDGVSAEWFLSLLAFGLPCLTIVICYTHIFFVVRKLDEKRMKRQASSDGHRGPKRREMRITKMILSILCSHVVCFLPFTIVNVGLEQSTSPNIHMGVEILAWASHVVNPYIYAIVNKTYRRSYVAIIPCKKVRDNLLVRLADISSTEDSNNRSFSRSRVNTLDSRLNTPENIKKMASITPINSRKLKETSESVLNQEENVSTVSAI